MKLLVPATLIIAVLGAAPATAALPQTAGSNITIRTCAVKLPPAPHASQGPNRHGLPARSYTVALSTNDGLTIAFTNDAHVAAKEVDFRFGTGQKTLATVRDSGSFAPGVLVTHRFTLPHDMSVIGIGSAECRVTKVLYANGSHWPH